MNTDSHTLTVRVPEDRRNGGPIAGHDVEVLLDGEPVRDLRSLDLHVHANDVVTATLKILPGSVEVDTEILAEIDAEIDRKNVEAL